MKKVRVDKWLWSIRIFKTRTLSTNSCKAGKIKINDSSIKPSYQLVGGETLQVVKNGFNLVIQVDSLINKRVSAPLAQECYTDLTPADELKKFDSWFIGKKGVEHRDKGLGRPTKKERREIEGFKGERYYDEFDSEV